MILDGNNKVHIFDTTLRDGEQSPGASMTAEEKVMVAKALAEMGVDTIEAGFAASSPGELEAVRSVARAVEGATVAVLSRCCKADIEVSCQALKEAKKARLHLFLATSPIHREHKLRMDAKEVVRRAVEAVSLGREFFDEVEFSAEDATRTEKEYLAEVLERVIEAGATVVNVPDTVGYTIPEEFSSLVTYLKQKVSNIDRAVLSVHCHNDLGLAVANSLAALKAGARQVECTVNGIGERAGNCALEEIVMALRTRKDVFGFDTRINTRALCPTSKLVESVTGMHVQRNKAVVGRNAFAHEAGIHQHGILAHRATYEIMKADEVGFTGEHLILGKHSGRHALRDWLDKRGVPVGEEMFQLIFTDFKQLADRGKTVLDADISALVARHLRGGDENAPAEGKWS